MPLVSLPVRGQHRVPGETASLVLGIISLSLSCAGFLAFAGLVCGLVGISKALTAGKRLKKSSGIRKAGLVGTVLSAIVTIFIAYS